MRRNVTGSQALREVTRASSHARTFGRRSTAKASAARISGTLFATNSSRSYAANAADRAACPANA